MARHAFRALIAGTLGGIVILGAGGRLVMRLLALMAHRPLQFGWGATLGILLIGGILGAIGGLVFALTAARLRSTPLLKGALYGTLLLLLLIPLQPSAIQQEITALRGHLLAAGVLFWLVWASYGVLLATIVTRGEDP
jgi:hypothetical protein